MLITMIMMLHLRGDGDENYVEYGFDENEEFFSGTEPPNQMIHGHLSIAVAMQPQRQFTLKLKLFFFLGYPCSTVTPHARLHPTPTDLFIESLSAPSRVFLQNLQLVIRCV